MNAPAAASYVLDNAMEHAHFRLTRLEAVYDPGTTRVLDTIGIRPGWTCLEVGAGAGSIANWLSDRVGPTGHVTATDIDPRFLWALAENRPNVEVLQHNIVTDDLPTAAFDLIHLRLVLEHLPARDLALDRLVGALAPGGWLVVESIDFGSEATDPAVNPTYVELFERLHRARLKLLADNGFDHAFARGLPRRLAAHGMSEIGTEGRAYTWSGGATGTGSTDVWLLSVRQMRETFIGRGYLTATDVQAIESMIVNPAFAATSPLVMAAWGRKPF